jgi:hypothetical protein
MGVALSILTVEDVVGSPVVIAEVVTLAVVVVVVNVTVKVLVEAGMVVFTIVVVVLVQHIILTTKIINIIPMPKYFFKFFPIEKIARYLPDLAIFLMI